MFNLVRSNFNIFFKKLILNLFNISLILRLMEMLVMVIDVYYIYVRVFDKIFVYIVKLFYELNKI